MNNNENEKRSGSLNRRDLLKVITAAPAAALVPLAPALGGAAPAPHANSGPETKAPYQPKFFNAQQYRTITVLSDLIVPADERSGSATQAGVPQFMDDWLRVAGGMMGTEILGSLTWIDMECNRLFDRDFADCSTAQQKQILDRIAYPDRAAPEDANAAAAFNDIRSLVLGGFFSSKMGIKDLPYLGNQVVEDWVGCPKPDLDQLGVSYNDDWAHWKTTT
ncbi:MAG: gluconate 2-dehydrogenase subunit 3 family protein [Terriglobia bacterium]